jgi:signal transduction histidine kinase
MPDLAGADEIQVTLEERPLITAMWSYGRTIFYLSLVISIFTAALLFVAVRRFIVRPISRVVGNMRAFEGNPEDVRAIIEPTAKIDELREAESALRDMQTQVSSSLKQKDRLAALGGAVARISHDLRNMLTTAQLLADRMEQSADPAVQRTAPKLVNSLSRAVNLCESTLTFGKAEEQPPSLQHFDLAKVVDDVVESDLSIGEQQMVEIISEIEAGQIISADPEQLYRVLNNLVRNAKQAIEGSGKAGTVKLSSSLQSEGMEIFVEDTGPGLPKRALEHLFKPFEGGARRGGSGLGLAIAAELVRGHGGMLELTETSEAGTTFRVYLPQQREAA